MSDQARDPEVAKKRLGTRAVVGWVLVLGILAGVGATWVRGTDSDSGPSYPSTWDPRVASLAAYVEDHRGLKFKHPVYVEFLSDAEFVKQVTDDGSDLTAADKKDLTNEQSLLRALGLISGKTDLLKATNALQGAGVIGLYNNEDKKIRVRGDQLTPSVRVTLVHEMTHALQDQYFDLSATFKRLDDDKDSDSSAFHAIVEGDATRIQDDYQASLPASDRAAIARQDAKDGARFQSGAASVPEVMQALFAAPYPLGEYAVQTALAKGGNTAVDALFTNPPTTDRSILDPSLIDVPAAPASIPALVLGAGETEVDRGVFGTLPLFLMMSKNSSYWASAFLAGADVSDRYLQYTKGSTSCVRAEFEATDAGTAKGIHDGLTLWAQGAHTGATVTQAGTIITINSCDPGPSYVPSADHSNDALTILTTRNAIYTGVRRDGAPAGFAICYADGVVEHYSVAELARLNANDVSAADKAELQKLGLACRNQVS